MIRLRVIAVATAALFLLDGCYNQPGLVADTSYDRTKTGAVAGAMAGAAIGYGANKHDRGKGAAVGALIGAVVGGGAGYLLDEQANAVANALGTGVDNDPLAPLDPNRDIIVSRHPNFVRIMFRDRMMFATDSAVLQSHARNKILKVARVLRQYPQTIVGVAGFTDSRGSYQYNRSLSERRARSVANLLNVNGRPFVKGCSYSKPLVPNTSAANMALNRRVEVYLYADRNRMSDPCR